MQTVMKELACVAGGMRERASGGRAAIFLSGEAREEFASGEAASELLKVFMAQSNGSTVL